MRRILLLAALGALSPARSAAAQSQFPVLLVNVNGVTKSTDLGRPFNAADCADAANIPVTLALGSQNLAPSQPTQDMWIGRGSTACEDGSNRNSSTTNSSCESLGQTPSTVQNREVTMTFADMLGSKIDPCTNTALTGAAYRLYFFDTSTSPYYDDPVGVNWGYLGGSQTGTAQFVVDTQAPAAPQVKATAISGTQPTVSWQVASGTETQLTYRAYVYTSGACGTAALDGGMLDSGVLDAGMPDAGMLDAGTLDGGAPAGTPTVPAGYVAKWDYQGNGRTSAGLPLNELGVPAGTVLTVYITVLDFAFNESQPSQVVCATYLPTGDFCTISGTCGNLCNCSVPGAPTRHAPLALLAALPLLGLWFARRRRYR